MLPYLEVGLSLMSAASGGAIAWVVAQSTRGRENAGHARRVAEAHAAQAVAEQRATEAHAETVRWRGMSLATATFSPALKPVYAARPAPVDAVELTRLVHGLSLVDDVMVADGNGLAMVPELDGGSAILAAAAAPAAGAIRALATSGLAVAQVAFASFSAEHLTVRPLRGRGDGLFLVLKTTSQRANPLVLDAVAHAASRAGERDLAPTSTAKLEGTTETRALDQPVFGALYADLVRELRNDVRAVVLTLDGQPVFSAAANGPAEEIRDVVAGELAALQLRATRLMRSSSPIARVELTLRDGTQIAWAALAPESRLALVTFGRIDERAVDRLSGRLRRIVDTVAHGRAA